MNNIAQKLKEFHSLLRTQAEFWKNMELTGDSWKDRRYRVRGIIKDIFIEYAHTQHHDRHCLLLIHNDSV
jgi:hypothetical protein